MARFILPVVATMTSSALGSDAGTVQPPTKFRGSLAAFNDGATNAAGGWAGEIIVRP